MIAARPVEDGVDVPELLATVDVLPPGPRIDAHRRIAAAVDGDAASCRAALAVLARELASAETTVPTRRTA